MSEKRGAGRPPMGKKIQIRIPDLYVQQLDILCRVRHIKRSALIREIINKYLHQFSEGGD